MPLPFHLIDGYNLLHAAGLARAQYGPGDLERARYALLARIADGLNDEERERTTVVFDATDPPIDADRESRFRDMAVRYSVETGDADALIESMIRRHSSPRQLRVVSDDIRLQRAAKRRGAQAVKCDALLRRLDRAVESRRAVRKAALEPHTNTGSEPVREWLEFFGLEEDATLQPTNLDVQNLEAPSASTPQAPGSKTPVSPKSAEPVKPVKKGSSPAPRPPRPLSSHDAEPPAGESIDFWQQRIDEVVSEERANRPRKPS